MIVHPETGEVMEMGALGQLTDEELGDLLARLEQDYKQLQSEFFSVRMAMIARMEEEGAKLKITPEHKLRYRVSTSVKEDRESKELLAKLVEEVPKEMRKGFKTEVKASVTALREIAKLGGKWKEKAEALLTERSYVVIEPRKQDEDEPELERHLCLVKNETKGDNQGEVVF